MSAKRPRRTPEEMKAQIISVAAKSFLEKGFTETTLKSVAERADVNIGSLMNLFESKEAILCELINFVIETQSDVAIKMLNGITEDKMLLYATETCLQLHIVEMSNNLRDVYCSAYSLPKTSDIIQHTKTGRLENIFKEHLPDLETKDFYMLEIATGGIMRGFMTVPCDMWFTIDHKIEAFLKTNFAIYHISEDKIQEAIEFVKQFDFNTIAKQTVDSMIKHLENKTKQFLKFTKKGLKNDDSCV